MMSKPKPSFGYKNYGKSINTKEMVRKPKFEMSTGSDGGFYFRLKVANGEVVLPGAFATKYAAMQAIASVMRYGAMETRFLRRIGRNFTPVAGTSREVARMERIVQLPAGPRQWNHCCAARRAVWKGARPQLSVAWYLD